MSTETMRNSGIEWIGDVPAHWELKRLKYTSTLAGRIGWQGLTSEEYRTEGVHLVTGTDFKEGRIAWDSCVRVSEARWAEATQVQLQEGDLLITKDGTVGKVAKCVDLPGKASLNSGVMVIRHKVPMSTHFLYWVLQSPVFTGWFSDVNAGASTISHLYQADFYNFGFYVPPTVREQELVASLLDAETAKIDQAMSLLRRELETMEQLKKSLIYEAVTKGLDPTVPMRPSGVDWIGDIPEHWGVKRLKYLCKMNSGTNLTSEEISETGDYPVYGGNGIRGYYSEFNNDSSRVLVGRQGALCGNVQLGVAPFWATDHAVVVKELSGYGKKYAFYALTAMNLNRLSMAAAQPGLSVEKIVCEFSPVPPLAEQESVASALESKLVGIEAVLEKKHEQLEVLKQQRQSLIIEYVTGKRRVSEVA
ncbi:restriction endonuclease subunit S [Lawsonella clevelandensis]|uniref:restriction endonuclease subunit S n=1 Tax=Lawsonella clevelandensis TaxID=1528099 RepID=UPI0023F12E05|nr:restriction endonuclease subunit S [Lawsonella clevelandensis]